MKFYQEMTSSNAYLEFVSESSSMTDLIMRIDAVKKLSEFNKNKLEEMENLIKSNEQKNVDLVNYEKQLNSNIASYEKKIEELDTSLLNLVDIGVDINDEIDIVTKNINHYKSLGCGENQKFTECAKFAYNGTWLKPVNSGMVTSLFGLRTLNGKTGSHSGIDIGVPEKLQYILQQMVKLFIWLIQVILKCGDAVDIKFILNLLLMVKFMLCFMLIYFLIMFRYIKV